MAKGKYKRGLVIGGWLGKKPDDPDDDSKARRRRARAERGDPAGERRYFGAESGRNWFGRAMRGGTR